MSYKFTRKLYVSAKMLPHIMKEIEKFLRGVPKTNFWRNRFQNVGKYEWIVLANDPIRAVASKHNLYVQL